MPTDNKTKGPFIKLMHSTENLLLGQSSLASSNLRNPQITSLCFFKSHFI